MKPFNLEAALAGEPVVTRDGREVTQLVAFTGVSGQSLRGVVDKGVAPWNLNGKSYWYQVDPAASDLFMAAKKEKRWVTVSIDPCFCTSYQFRSLEIAKAFVNNVDNNWQIIEIEVEV